MKKIIVAIIIVLLAITIFIGTIFITSNAEAEKIIKKEELLKNKKENDEIENKERVDEKIEPIKWGRYSTTISADKEIIKKNMKKYDDNTYILPIKDIETFEKMQETFGMNVTGYDGGITSETFEKYDYEVLLIFIEEQEEWIVKNVSSYKSKVVIEFGKPEISTEEVKFCNMFCVGIPKLYNNENVEVTYESKDILVDLNESVDYRTSECYVKNLQEFENIYFLHDDEQELYYTNVLDIHKYNDLIENLGMTVRRTIPQKTIQDKDIILVFRKTNSKIELKSFKYSKDGILIGLTETNAEYGKGISGLIIILEKGKYDKYKFYMENSL